VIEAYPKQINQEKLEANLNKLVSAFLMVTEDLVAQETQNKNGEEKAVLDQAPITERKSLALEKQEIESPEASCNNPLQTFLLSAVRTESKREPTKQ